MIDFSDEPRPDTPPQADTHTPGPWRRGRSHWNAIVCDTPVPGIKGSDHVAHYGGHLIAESVAENNQDIIAAAPDLLGALRAVMAEWREGYGLNCVDQVRAAIAKAEGR